MSRSDEFNASPEQLGRVPLRSGQYVSFEALVDVPVDALASLADQTIDQFLDDIERWATGIGLPYGFVVDRDAHKIERLGGPWGGTWSGTGEPTDFTVTNP